MARPLAHKHGLEKRSDMLAAAIKAHIDTVANAITPQGGRPPFTRKMSAREAFDWWLKHRYDHLGMSEWAKLTPIQQQQLDAWLNEAVQATGTQPKLQPINDVQSILSSAETQERKAQGPPPTAVVS